MRRMRKWLGLPATIEAGAISRLLEGLRAEAERYLGHSTKAASVTHPDLIALYEEDLKDALDFIGLGYIGILRSPNLLTDAFSILAGHGIGLCKHYTNPKICMFEEKNMTRLSFAPILFTRTILTLSSVYTPHSAYGVWTPFYAPPMLDFNLGSEKESDPLYWKTIETTVKTYFQRDINRPSVLFLHGESSGDPRFIAAVSAAVADFKELPTVNNDDYIYVAARGAAEFARRAPFDMPYIPGPNVTTLLDFDTGL
jgi:hypothetical protein